jgi:hypothetical protein
MNINIPSLAPATDSIALFTRGEVKEQLWWKELVLKEG